MPEEIIDQAMMSIARAGFLPIGQRVEANEDRPIYIGYGQTNSQPSTVRMMLEWLDPQPGNHVIDVGSGSGWTTALLAHLVEPEGHVTAVERIPELVAFGRGNCMRAGISNVEFHEAGDTIGWPDNAPYDRILVSAAATDMPVELIEQLSDNARAVIPIRSSVWVVEKRNGELHSTEFRGFAFVPLV